MNIAKNRPKSGEESQVSIHKDLITSEETCAYAEGISKTTLYRWIAGDRVNFPKQIRLGLRKVKWRKSSIDEWHNKREAGV